MFRTTLAALGILIAASTGAWAQPAGIKTPADLIAYFNSIAGKNTISGQFLGTTGMPPINAIQASTGKWVGMIGGDYWLYGSWTGYDDQFNAMAIDYWNKGGLVALELSMPNPTTLASSGDVSRLDRAGLLTAGTATNKALNGYLQQAGTSLLALQAAGVVPIVRLYHEGNGAWTWWGTGGGTGGGTGITAPEFIALWRYSVDYFTKMGLHNIVYNYSVNAGWPPDMTSNYPGDSYVGMVGYDMYSNNPGPDGVGSYNTLKQYNKPIAFDEFGPGAPSKGDPTFSLSTLVNQIKANVPNAVYWLQWWDGNAGGAGWGMAETTNAKAALADPFVLNRGQIIFAPPVGGTESATNSLVTTVGPVLIDALGNSFSINSAQQIVLNNVVDAQTQNVVDLAYVNGVMWHKNTAGNWYSYLARSSYGGGLSASPLPVKPTTQVSINVPDRGALSIPAELAGVVTGISVHDTSVNGLFHVFAVAKNGTLSAPGTRGSGTAAINGTGPLGTINRMLAYLVFIPAGPGPGSVTITASDPATSTATATVNVQVGP